MPRARRTGLAGARGSVSVGGAIILALGLGCPGEPAAADDTAAVQCIAATQEKLGGLNFLRASCTSRQDCTYQAPTGNASAIALLNGAADTVQTCWRSAGLTQTESSAKVQGVIRTYARPGETCKLLLAMTLGSMAEGFRAACQSDTAR